LAGASVVVKGTSIGASTDFDGNFSITLQPNNNVLLVSYVGYKNSEITVGNQIKINIILGDEFKSEKTKALTKSDYRKKRRADNKVRRDSRRGKNTNTTDLNNEMLKAVGRTVKTAIKKNSRNN
jgi:hypothetical protein